MSIKARLDKLEQQRQAKAPTVAVVFSNDPECEKKARLAEAELVLKVVFVEAKHPD